MKKFIILLSIIVPGFLMAQMSESQLWENARYQVVQNGVGIFYTDVNTTDVNFTEDILIQVKEQMFQKEGIVKVELENSNNTIRVYHFDYIELETVKDFVLLVRGDIELMNRVEHQM